MWTLSFTVYRWGKELERQSWLCRGHAGPTPSPGGWPDNPILFTLCCSALWSSHRRGGELGIGRLSGEKGEEDMLKIAHSTGCVHLRTWPTSSVTSTLCIYLVLGARTASHPQPDWGYAPSVFVGGLKVLNIILEGGWVIESRWWEVTDHRKKPGTQYMQGVDRHTQIQKSAGDHSGLLKIVTVTGCPRMRKLKKIVFHSALYLFTAAKEKAAGLRYEWAQGGC